MSSVHRRVVRGCVASLSLALVASAAVAAADAPALRFEALAIGDTLHADEPSFTTALGHLDLRLTGNAARLFGWPATTFRLEALADDGAKPNGRVGTLQGISNIEVRRNAARLYAAWLQHAFSPGLDLLVGLYDLNSEFYSTDASSLLIHPAFGIGAELAQTGRNGPSIFPDLAAGVRVRARSQRGTYAQVAVLAASAGDPDHPGRTVVRISRREGALIVAEGGWQATGRDDDGVGHWGLGVWGYSEPVERIDGRGRATNAGVYALGQTPFRNFAGQRIVGFARSGIVAASVDPIALALDAGVRGQRAQGGNGPDAWSVGVALARIGRASMTTRALQGQTDLHRTEATIEMGARWRLGAGFALQPLAQHVTHVAGRRTSATVLGVRWIWSLPGGDE